MREVVQALVGTGAGVRGVELSAERGTAVVQRAESEQPLAFHIGADVDEAWKYFQQLSGPVRFTGTGGTVSDQ